MGAETTCIGDDCERTDRLRRGACPLHYRRLLRYGDPNYKKSNRGDAQKLITQVLAGSAPTEENGCILWPFSTLRGYALGTWNGTTRRVGRVILEHFQGEPPTPQHTMGHAPHDVCGNRNCIAPDHLSWQTRVEQVAQMKTDGTFVPPPPWRGAKK